MRIVLFDLDGTLLDGSRLPGAMQRTCEIVAADHPGTSADALVAANTAAWRTLWPEVEEQYMLTDRGAAANQEAWRRTLATCGLRGDDAVAHAEAVWEREERAAFRLYDDARPTLDRLAGAGVRLGMVTNGAAAVQRRKLAAVGLTDRFDPLVISSDVGVAKPDPAIFGIALSRSGVPAAETLFVGDNLWHDVPGATASGIPTAWLDRHGVALQPDWPQPTQVIASLDEIVPGQEPR